MPAAGRLDRRVTPQKVLSLRYGWPRGSDRRWRKLRARKLADEPRCQPCLAKGLVTVATEVHHRMPISEGGAKYDWDNLESVCGGCQDEAHGAKPKIRFDIRTGLPLPGQDHPWSDPE